jgi:hypothetical protein
MLDLDALAAKAKALGDAALPAVSDDTELHIDGDYCAYYFSGNDETPFGDARSNMVRTLDTVRRIAGAGGRSVIHLTAGGSHKGHRYQIATVKPYQGQRDSSRRPKNWDAMRAWLEGGVGKGISDHKVKLWEDREADDGVALSAKFAWDSKRLPAIFSRDKDFRMIPGRHVTWTTLGLVEVRPETWAITDEDGDLYGQKWFWMQMLQGDSADAIPGLPKQPGTKPGTFKDCGPKCAEEYLANAKDSSDAFRTVRGLYQAFYAQAWAPAFAEQAALLWLRTDMDASVGNFMRAVPAVSPELDAAVRQLERRIK